MSDTGRTGDGAPAETQPSNSPARATWDRWLLVTRIVAVLGQAVTLLVTWPLWSERAYPPALPLVPLALPFGVILLASLGVVLWRPAVGIPAHAAAYALAVVADQVRWQPYTVAIAVVLIGTLPSAAPRMLARAYLLALWFYAGLHKLLELDEYVEIPISILGRACPWLPESAAHAVGLLSPWIELGIPLLLLTRRARRAGMVLAVLFHAGVLGALVTIDYNPCVWAWNVVLAVAAVGLYRDDREAPTLSLAPLGPIARTALVALLLYPLGYSLCVVDAYASHVLYSPTMTSWVVEESEFQHSPSVDTYEATGAFLPNSRRIHKELFELTAAPGDTLILEDPRGCGEEERYRFVDGELVRLPD